MKLVENMTIADAIQRYVDDVVADKTSKLQGGLASLYKEYTTETTPFQVSNSIIKIGEKNWVSIDAVADSDANTLLAELKTLGLKHYAVAGNIVSGIVPVEAIGEIASLESMRFARQALFTTNVGAVTSQADVAMRADVARSSFDVDGTGITVGVLSDSFNALGGAANDVATGDLPGLANPLGNTTPVNVLQDPASGSDEGRAMLQLIHDVAPGADLAFHTANFGQANFANGIRRLATEAGSDVIVDDIIYFAEPMFQDGIIAQAVDEVVADGVAYFSSSGNNNRNGYESAFNPSGLRLRRFGELHDFDPGSGVDVYQSITVPVNTTLSISFQWDSPFFSVSGGAGSPNDLDIFLLNGSGNRILARSADNNIGNDPVEILQFRNDGSFGTNRFNLAISNSEGPNPDLMKYVLFGNSTINEFRTESGTVYGHANAAGAEAVGAAFYQQTPEFGVDPAQIESFSSPGPTPILFDTSGNRLPDPEIRLKPEIVAPDGTNNTFFGRDITQDPDSFPNFFGTSAAAPHAAAVAALMLEAAPGTSPNEIYTALENTALDMDDPSTPGFDVGYDFGTGSGLIQADLAIQQLLEDGLDNGGFETRDYSEAQVDNFEVVPGGLELIGTSSDNTLFGQAGNDILIGLGGQDILLGEEGNDTVVGGNGDDQLFGAGGDDIIVGGNGNDLLFGEAGNDILNGGAGNNTLTGGAGQDIFVLSILGKNTIADFEVGQDSLQLFHRLTFGSLSINDQDNGTQILANNTKLAFLSNVKSNEISVGSFATV